jgi:uncharacterized membrane protein
MWYASEKETLKENGNQYAGGVGLVAFAFQFAINFLEEIVSVFVFVMQHISIRLIFSSIVCGWESILWPLCFLSLSLLRGS